MNKASDILRDYSLLGVESIKVIEMGLVDAEWYQTPVPAKNMQELLTRKDGPAIRDTILWFGLIALSGYLFYFFWHSWIAVLPYIVYSTLYASSSDSRWHESSHGTAFKTDWMNNLLYEISSFMVFRQSTVWRYSHTRHHSDTIIRGRDPEISMPRPPRYKRIILGILGLGGAIPEIRQIILHATGKIDKQVATYVPNQEFSTVIFKARIYLLIYGFMIFLSIYFGTLLPLMFIGFPTFFGGWLMRLYGWTQHAGLQENVLDHRLNSRTVYMNRIHRFLYWNMNYHVEHHMFPLVPYHALPKLHELIKYDCPVPKKGIINSYKEIIPAIFKQMKNPNYFIKYKLPKNNSPVFNPSDDIIVGDPDDLANGKILVCKLSQLDIGGIIRFDFNQKTYAIYRTDKDEVYASDGMCTHGNAHLAKGVIIGDQIECAKHNGRFNLKDGCAKRIPACIKLKTYSVTVLDEKIYLNFPNKLEEKERDSGSKTLKVLSNHNLGNFIKELTLEIPAYDEFSFKPGQYIQLEIPPHELQFSNFNIDKKHLETWNKLGLFKLWSKNTTFAKRNYSLANNPSNKATLKFNIRIATPPNLEKVVSSGVGSSYVYSLKPGDLVKIDGPFGDFLPKESNREMIYLGGGAGMAPIRSHLSHLLETENSNRKISFWYGARSLGDLFYDSYFYGLEKEKNNFNFKVALSDPEENDQWNGERGFIHEVLLMKYLSNHKSPKEIEYYLCGPPAMIKASMKMLNELEIPAEMITFDEF